MAMMLNALLVGALGLMTIVTSCMIVKRWPSLKIGQRATASLFAITLMCAMLRAVFYTVSSARGGTVANGKVVGQHYFLGSHGRYREVSQNDYEAIAKFDQISDILLSCSAVPLLAILLFKGFFREPGSQWSVQSVLDTPSNHPKGGGGSDGGG